LHQRPDRQTLKDIVKLLDGFGSHHEREGDGSAYQEYVLTKKGRELFPVIVALRQWGENYLFSRGEERLQIVDKGTRKPPRRLDVQNVRGDTLTANDLELVTVTT
jgi:hypothetical protein